MADSTSPLTKGKEEDRDMVPGPVVFTVLNTNNIHMYQKQ